MINAVLISSAVFAQEEMFLSLTRKAAILSDMPTNVSVITASEIKQKRATNAGEILKEQAGLISGQYGTYGANNNLMLRGSSPEQVLILVDGRRINDPSMGLVNVSAIPANNIEKIEIIRGGASAIYGTGAFGGIINIITKQPKEDTPSIELGVSGGSFNTQAYQLNMSAKKGPISATAAAGKSLSNGYRQNSKFDSQNFFARFGYDAGTAGSFDLSSSFYTADFGVPGVGITLDKYDGELERTASSPDVKQKDTKSYWRLEHTIPISDNTLKSSVYASDNLTNYNYPSNFQNDDYKTVVFGGDAQFYHRIGTTFGAEWWQEMYKSYDNMFSNTKIDKNRIIAAAFLQQELKLNDFTFIPSARYDNNSIFGGIFSPRITVTYRASDALKFSANSAKAWRAPTFNELYWQRESFTYQGTTYITEGNTNLVPEEGITSDIGAEYTAKDYKTSLTAFVNTSDKLISWVSSFDQATNTSLYKTQNINKSRQAGAEFTFNHKLASGLYHSVNYTYLWAEDTESHTLLTYRPRNTANYKVTYLTALNTRFDVSAQYSGDQQTGSTPSALPEFTLVNVGVSQVIKDSELWVKANNVTDKKYQTRNKYPLPGINYMAGVTVKFWK